MDLYIFIKKSDVCLQCNSIDVLYKLSHVFDVHVMYSMSEDCS